MRLVKFISAEFIPVFVLIGIVSYYNYFSNFHFLPITEGWFSVYANLVINGKVPYKDFYLYLTPLYTWIIASIQYFLGESLFSLRIFGFIVIALMAFVLFRILKSIFSPVASLIGTTCGILYIQKGVAFISYDFTQVLTLFALISIYFLILASDKLKTVTVSQIRTMDYLWFHKYFIFSGFFASCCFLVKQSNGAFIAIGISLALFYSLANKGLDTLALLFIMALFLIGALTPAILVMCYLAANGALEDFFSQILFNAISAKGGLQSILGGWLPGVFNDVLRQQLLEILYKFIPFFIISRALLFFLRMSSFCRNMLDRYNVQFRELICLLLFAFLFILVITLSWNNDSTLRRLFFDKGMHLTNYIIPLSISWIGLCLLAGIAVKLTPQLQKPSEATIILSFGALGLTFGNGTSAGLSEISAFIALSWCISWTVQRNSIPFAGIPIVFYFTLVLTTALCYTKFDKPYSWWGTSEGDSRSATLKMDHRILSGIYLNKDTFSNYVAITEVLKEHSLQGSIFSFPNIPMIYLLANQLPETKAVIGWFDFLNDKDADAEAERISADPPNIIAYLQLPDEVLEVHERLFRAGLPLGQRKIVDFINHSCLEQNGYTIILKRAISSTSTIFICKRTSNINS
jgi:hypothetical protein